MIVELEKKIVKRGRKWLVTNEAGTEVLGTHDTRQAAEEQLAAIEASKKRRKRKDYERSFRGTFDLNDAIRQDEKPEEAMDEEQAESGPEIFTYETSKPIGGNFIQAVKAPKVRKRMDPNDMNARLREVE